MADKITTQTRRVQRGDVLTTTTTETITRTVDDTTAREPSGPRYVKAWIVLAAIAGAWLAFIVATDGKPTAGDWRTIDAASAAAHKAETARKLDCKIE